MGGCNSEPAPAAVKLSDGGCIADSLAALRLIDEIPPCKPDAACNARCLAGDGPACLAMADTMETSAPMKGAAQDFYGRACRLGVANACTNYAATIWAGTHTDEQLACARRVLARQLEAGKLGAYPPGRIRALLTRACAGGDAGGCGAPATAAETFQ